MNDSPECGNCRFCVLDKDGDGQCRRYPPAVLVDEGTWATVWPVVESDDFCGEWKPAQ